MLHLQIKLLFATISLLCTSASTTNDAGMAIEAEVAAVGADGRTLAGGRFELRGEAGDMAEVTLVGGRFALVGDITENPPSDHDSPPPLDETPATNDKGHDSDAMPK
jgi:hypothetical protein